MPRPGRRHTDLIATADAQLGLITAAQLAELGVHTSTTSRRVAGGMWTRILPGVHLVGGGSPTRLQREMATVLYAGDGSMLTGTPALRRYGFRSLRLQETVDDENARPEPVHVLIPHDRRRASTGFARIERTHRLPLAVRMRGLPLAPLVRAVGDGARRMRRQSDATAVVAEAIQRGMATRQELLDELRAGPVRGSAFFRQALDSLASGAHSGPEADLVAVLEHAGVPDLVCNARLVRADGAFVAIADVWLDDVGVALEVDSVEYHATGDGFAGTVRRNSRYAAAGVLVVAVLPRDIRERPAWVLAQVEAARVAAAALGRPAVHVDTTPRASAGLIAWPWGA
jgi:hypothetical protein